MSSLTFLPKWKISWLLFKKAESCCCRGHNQCRISPALKWFGPSQWSGLAYSTGQKLLFRLKSHPVSCRALDGWRCPQCKLLKKSENFFASLRGEVKMSLFRRQVKKPFSATEICTSSVATLKVSFVGKKSLATDEQRGNNVLATVGASPPLLILPTYLDPDFLL